MSYFAEITLENPGSQKVDVQLPRGSLLETTDPRSQVQNLVVAKDYRFTVHPRATLKIRIDCYCANQTFSAPSDTPMRLTPFVSKVRLDSQEAAWRFFSPN